MKADPGKRLEVFDAQEPGLLIRVSSAKRRTWYFRYRLPDGRQPRMKLGTYPATSIAEAREKAQQARRALEGVMTLPRSSARKKPRPAPKRSEPSKILCKPI